MPRPPRPLQRGLTGGGVEVVDVVAECRQRHEIVVAVAAGEQDEHLGVVDDRPAQLRRPSAGGVPDGDHPLVRANAPASHHAEVTDGGVVVERELG